MGKRAGQASIMHALRNVKLSNRRKRELASFLHRLRRLLKVEEVYIFGSRIYGSPLEDSDLDILIVSEEFGKRNYVENLILLAGLWDGSITLEMFPYTPSQIRMYRDRKTVVAEALTKGIRIKLSDTVRSH
jgi:predicted nucleotidyltransferase